MFVAKLGETLFRVEEFCEELCRSSEEGAADRRSTVCREAKERFCELAVDYLRLRMHVRNFWTLWWEGRGMESDVEAFVAEEYKNLFVQLPGGIWSLEHRPVEAPSLGWLRSASGFKLLQLFMDSLLNVESQRSWIFLKFQTWEWAQRGWNCTGEGWRTKRMTRRRGRGEDSFLPFSPTSKSEPLPATDSAPPNRLRLRRWQKPIALPLLNFAFAAAAAAYFDCFFTFLFDCSFVLCGRRQSRWRRLCSPTRCRQR